MKKKEGMRWCAAIALSLAALLFLLRMLIIWRDVDAATGLFRDGSSILCLVFNGVSVALLLGGMLSALLIRQARKKKGPRTAKSDPVREILERTDPLFSEAQDPEDRYEVDEPVPRNEDVSTAATWEGTLSAFSYFLPGFGFLFFAMATHFATVQAAETAAKGSGSKSGIDYLILLFILFSIASGAYFLFAGIYNRTEKKTLLAFGGLIPAVWATLRMIIEYRNVEKYTNRGMYIANLVFLVALICFFIYQAQVILGNETYAMPLSWFAAALLVLVFGISARMPQLIGLLLSRLGEMDLLDAASLLLDLSLTLFAALKIRRMIR